MTRVLPLLLVLAWVPPRAPPSAGYWGFALAHHPAEARRQGFAYPPSPAALTGMGANAVLLTPSWTQADIHASDIDRGEVRDTTWRSTIRHSRELGLRVAIAPWIDLEHAAPHEWRGIIAPDDRRAWWRSYRRFVLHFAQLASEERVDLFAIGSELSSRDADPEWDTLAADVREIFDGEIAFVANHDALTPRAFESVDVLGVSAYFPVDDSWEPHAQRLRALHERHDKPIVIFEVGFPSRAGALREPWNDANGAPVDLLAQQRGYRLLTRSLRDATWLEGLFFWTWFGGGGPHDRHYTPLGKPAEADARALLEARTRASLGSRGAAL